MLELTVFFLKLLHSFEFVHLHASVLGLPVVNSGFGHSVITGNILDVFARIILLENVENLGFGKSCSFHF